MRINSLIFNNDSQSVEQNIICFVKVAACFVELNFGFYKYKIGCTNFTSKISYFLIVKNIALPKLLLN